MAWTRTIYCIYRCQSFLTEISGGPQWLQGPVMQLTVVWWTFYCRKHRRVCLPRFFFLADDSVHRHPDYGHPSLAGLHSAAQIWSLKVNPKQWKTWPKMKALLISRAYAWQIRQMGSVSKHPLWPRGSSSSCTGATHKHTNEILTEIKWNRGQSGFNLG